MIDVDVYFSFRSPYSYLATPGMLQIKKNYDINLILRPIFPVAIRTRKPYLARQTRRGPDTFS